jgi:hypothetical protein
MITTNINAEDGLVNGAIGVLKYTESGLLNDNIPTCLWFHFENENMGAKPRIKSKPHVLSKRGVWDLSWTPVNRRTCNTSLGGKVKCKRMQFLVVLACALAVHKSQGGTFDRIVYDYNKSQQTSLVYAGLNKVTSIDGLYLTNANNSFNFYHGRGSNTTA